MDFSRLEAAATKNTDAVAAAVEVFRSLAGEIADNAQDAAKIEQLAGQLEQSAQTLAESIVAGTPAEEPPGDPQPV